MAAFWSDELKGDKHKIWIWDSTNSWESWWAASTKSEFGVLQKSNLSGELKNFVDFVAAFWSEELKGFSDQNLNWGCNINLMLLWRYEKLLWWWRLLKWWVEGRKVQNLNFGTLRKTFVSVDDFFEIMAAFYARVGDFFDAMTAIWSEELKDGKYKIWIWDTTKIFFWLKNWVNSLM